MIAAPSMHSTRYGELGFSRTDTTTGRKSNAPPTERHFLGTPEVLPLGHSRDGDHVEREDEVGLGLVDGRALEGCARPGHPAPQDVLLEDHLDREIRITRGQALDLAERGRTLLDHAGHRRSLE